MTLTAFEPPQGLTNQVRPSRSSGRLTHMLTCRPPSARSCQQLTVRNRVPSEGILLSCHAVLLTGSFCSAFNLRRYSRRHHNRPNTHPARLHAPSLAPFVLLRCPCARPSLCQSGPADDRVSSLLQSARRSIPRPCAICRSAKCLTCLAWSNRSRRPGSVKTFAAPSTSRSSSRWTCGRKRCGNSTAGAPGGWAIRPWVSCTLVR